LEKFGDLIFWDWQVFPLESGAIFETAPGARL
jgi:hypothetical protein